MNGAVVAAWVAALSLATPQDGQNEGIERQIRFLTQTLRLSEDQAERVRSILKKQSDDLRSVLTEEQRERYDRLNRGRSSRSRRNRGWWPSTDELREQLSLSDEQAGRITEIRDSIRDRFRAFWQDRRGGDNARDEWESFQKKLREENTAKIRALLSDGQKAKFDKVMADFASAATVSRSRGGSSTAERVDRIMEPLRITNADEAAAIRSLVVRVVEAMRKISDAQRDARSRFEETARNEELSDETVGGRIDEIQSALKKLLKELATARQELAEVLTNRQELELLRRGILR